MTVSQSLNLYNISLRYFKNEADAKSFVSEIEIILDDKFESKKDTLATKIDLADIRAEMKDQKSEIIKWMFIFWVGQIAILAGIIFAMLNLYFKK
jgi:argonaute-like protein implicated in RNA metabolism and viral defense